MRVYIQVPDSLLGTLQDQARLAHRPPRYQLEWLIQQALQDRHTAEQRCLVARQAQPQEVDCANE